jgi:hypothetical protein
MGPLERERKTLMDVRNSRKYRRLGNSRKHMAQPASFPHRSTMFQKACRSLSIGSVLLFCIIYWFSLATPANGVKVTHKVPIFPFVLSQIIYLLHLTLIFRFTLTLSKVTRN